MLEFLKMYWVEIIKVICLFLLIWRGVLIIAKLKIGEGIATQSFLMFATGATGFIYLQWILV